MSLHETVNSVLSYVASAFVFLCQYIQDVSLMSVGAAILLISRLIVDVPKAYQVIRAWLLRRKTDV